MIRINKFQKSFLINCCILIFITFLSCTAHVDENNRQEKINVTTSPAYSPTPIFTNTPIRPTSTISITPTSTNPTTEVGTRIDYSYILINDSNQAIYIVDIQTGKPRQLISDKVDPLKVLSMDASGCELIVISRDHRVVRINLQAQLLQELLPINWYTGIGVVGKEALSPSGEWIAYIVGRGSQGYNSFEYQDVEVMNLFDRNIIPMTKNGGAWEVVWSHNGNKVAFSDFDENYIHQIFLAHVDGIEKYQLTGFQNELDTITLLRWSPDDKKLAFQSYNMMDQHTSLGIIFFGSNDWVVKTFPGISSGIRNFWWDDGDTLVIHLITTDKANSENSDGIIWLNTNTEQIIHELYESETPDYAIRSANFFGSGMVGFFSDQGFFTYELKTKMIQYHFDNFLNYSDWIAAPSDFGGEQNCIYP